MTSHAMDDENLNANAEEVLKDAQIPAVASRNEKNVRENFWGKVRRFAVRMPFARDAIACFYCATDATTPARAKGLLFAALAYFILPFDLLPDFIVALGFTDDAAVIALALSLISTHIKDVHYQKADEALKELQEAG